MIGCDEIERIEIFTCLSSATTVKVFYQKQHGIKNWKHQSEYQIFNREKLFQDSLEIGNLKSANLRETKHSLACHVAFRYI